MRIGILVPHIYAQQYLLDKVIFAPVHLAVDLADELSKEHDVFLFSPGPLETKATNINIDLSLVEDELKKEDCTLPQLVTHNPLSFTSLARQVQAELTAKAFEFANSGKLDVLHVFMCEGEIPLYFADLLNVPVVFTHHDPFNFYRHYRARFPRVNNLNYVSISDAQRKTAPNGTNFIATVYNGLDIGRFKFNEKPNDYFAFFGRIVRVKGCHNAIAACKNTGEKLRIAGKYYSLAGSENEDYWSVHVKPFIDDKQIFYDDFINSDAERSAFLGGAKALLFPIEWEEPFGMVMVEAMACGTPVIAFDCGSVREIIKDGVTGFVVQNVKEMEKAMTKIGELDREKCREWVDENFTLEKMTKGYLETYEKVLSLGVN